MASQNLPLSPYAHQLNAFGTACDPACPACRWSLTNVVVTIEIPCVDTAIELLREIAGNVAAINGNVALRTRMER